MDTTNTTAELPDFDALWDYAQPAATEQQLKELVPMAQQPGNEMYYMELLTQIARTQGLQRKFEAAHATLDSVKAMLPAEQAAVVPTVRYWLERGRAFNSNQQQEKAMPLFVQAYELASAHHKDGYAVDAAHMVAFAAIDTPLVKLEWEEKALALAESSNQEAAQKWRGSLYNNIGWSYHDLQQYEQALKAFEQSESWLAANSTPDRVRIARWSKAKMLRLLGRVEEAVNIQLELEKAMLEDTTIATDGYVYEELTECFLALGLTPNVARYARWAYEELSKDDWLVANEPERLERLKQLSHE